MTLRRFFPATCPRCESAVAPAYSGYRSARRHPLFAPFMAIGACTTAIAFPLALLVTGFITAKVLGGQNLFRKEKGFVFFLAFAATLLPIGLFTRTWWRGVHGLPKQFNYECNGCGWAGPCQMIEVGGPV